MKIIKIINGPLKEICYILDLDGKAFVIDPGLDKNLILNTIKSKGLTPVAVLLTHAHFDHIFSAAALKDMGAKVYVTEVDAPKLFDSFLSLGVMYGYECQTVVPNGFLKEGKNTIEGQEFEVVFTPGHTSGSCCIIYKNNIFTGDTYFEEGIYGRTDLLDGHQDWLMESIKKLGPYLKGKNIFPGHE